MKSGYTEKKMVSVKKSGPKKPMMPKKSSIKKMGKKGC